jgi:hypothetical protein
MAMASQLIDGLDALRAELSLSDIMRLIERTARWVSKETFELLPVWFPEHTRRGLFYKANWSEPQHNTNRQTGVSVHKHEGNNYASKALTHALGLRSRQRPNWSCCHMWGIDDASFGSSNVIVQDARFYSCVANMVLLPTPLKAFTDVMPDVKWMLRACAFHTYDWRCDHEMFGDVDFDPWTFDPAYPASWPKTAGDAPPPGTVPMTSAIASDADRRLAAIRRDLQGAGSFYPRQAVLEALTYWNLPGPATVEREGSPT